MKARLFVLAVSLTLVMAQAMRNQQGQPQAAQPQDNPQAQTPGSSAKASGTPAEMKTMTYKGVLTDMSCAGSGAAAPPQSENETANTKKSDSANRSAADTGTCKVTSSSTQLGMKLDDGKTVPFDLVGNQRALDELKNNKNWNKDLSAGKAIHAKVSGVMSGDKLIVSAIH